MISIISEVSTKLGQAQNAAAEVDIADVEFERLAGPQSGGDEKADEGLERGAPQSRCRAQLGGGSHQAGNLAVSVDVRCRAAELRWKKSLRRNLRPRVPRLEPG